MESPFDKLGNNENIYDICDQHFQETKYQWVAVRVISVYLDSKSVAV